MAASGETPPVLCDTVLPLLSVVIDDEATPAERSTVSAHILYCVSCASHLAFLRASKRAVFAWQDEYPSIALSERIARATYAAPIRIPLQDRLIRWLRPIPVRVGLGAAAAALLGVFFVLHSPSNMPVANNIHTTPSIAVTAKPAPRRNNSVVTAKPKPVKAVKPTMVASTTPAHKKIVPPRSAQTMPERSAESVATVPIDKSLSVVKPAAVVVPTKRIVMRAQSSTPTVTVKTMGKTVVATNKTHKPSARLAHLPTDRANKTVVAMNGSAKPETMPVVPIADTYSAKNGDNDERTTGDTAVVTTASASGDYSPESGKIRLTRRPNLPTTISLVANHGDTSPNRGHTGDGGRFGESPTMRGSVVSAPATLN